LTQCLRLVSGEILNFVSCDGGLEHPQVVFDGLSVDHLLENILQQQQQQYQHLKSFFIKNQEKDTRHATFTVNRFSLSHTDGD
jgi:hypothetical protein